jgi:hypothetical protein
LATPWKSSHTRSAFTTKALQKDRRQPGGLCSAEAIDRASKNINFAPESSYGSSTTHMAKLRPRLDGGSGGGCPVVVFGIRKAAYVED